MPAKSAALAVVRWYAHQPVLRAVVPGVLLIGLGLLVFGAMYDAVDERDDFALLDRPVLSFLVAARNDVATALLAGLTFITGPTVLPVVVLVVCVVWGRVRREWWRPLLLAGAMIGSTLVSLAVKGLVARPRPPEETMYIPGSETTGSFPSGHTIGTATFLFVAGYLVASRYRTVRSVVLWVVACVVGVCAVALSRLYLGYHFLTDVVAATGLALAVVGVVTILDRIHVVHGLPPSEPDPGWSPDPPSGMPGPSTAMTPPGPGRRRSR